MIEESAKVVEIGDGHVTVEVQRQSVCGQCAANKGCGTAVLQKVLGRRRTLIDVSYDKAVNIGDTIILGLSEQALVKGSMAVYLVPILLMIGFALFGEVMAEQLAVSDVNNISVTLAIIGLLFGMVWLKYFSRRISNSSNFQPIVLRTVPSMPQSINNIFVDQ